MYIKIKIPLIYTWCSIPSFTPNNCHSGEISSIKSTSSSIVTFGSELSEQNEKHAKRFNLSNKHQFESKIYNIDTYVEPSLVIYI